MSSELISRLSAFPRMEAALEVLPHKMLKLKSGEKTAPVVLGAEGHLDGRVQHVIDTIQRSTFALR